MASALAHLHVDDLIDDIDYVIGECESEGDLEDVINAAVKTSILEEAFHQHMTGSMVHMDAVECDDEMSESPEVYIATEYAIPAIVDAVSELFSANYTFGHMHRCGPILAVEVISDS